MVSSKNVAHAVGGKTARACDSCIKKRARWYCAADDAFLCQACDASVHSANPLARRHERVRLKTASLKSSSTADLHQPLSDNSVPSWHRGFAKRARTPRHGKSFSNYPAGKNGKSMLSILRLVPEVGADEISHEENEENQLLYRVPIYDPFVAELCTSANSNEAEKTAANDAAETADVVNGSESKAVPLSSGYNHNGDVDSLHGLILPSDMDLAEFADDVETLLGRGLENESFAMEELGLVDYRETGKVKVEEEEVEQEEEEEGVETAARDHEGDKSCKIEYNDQIDMEREPFEFNFDCDSPATCGDEDEKVIKEEMVMETNDENDQQDGDGAKKMKNVRKILLRLDYESVITAWASQGSPWTSGDRPDFDPDECWPQCTGTCGSEGHRQYPHHPYGEYAGIGPHPATVDGGREARVSRYREKRRTRLFSKKIRYEVRKLNAEKRPRMKGRFVKRASFAVPPANFPLFNK